MSSVNTVATLNGNFKKVYADMISNLLPDHVRLTPMIEFVPAQKMGGLNYNVPVMLNYSHGVTYGGDDATAFQLNAPVASTMKEATVRYNEFVLREAISVGAASRAVASEGSFVRATKHIVQNMIRSARHKLEVEMLYGQMGLAKVSSISGNVITVQDAHWASGIWIGAKDMRVEIYDTATSTKRGEAKVTKVDPDLKQLTLDVMPAGVVANDDIYEFSAFGKEFAGIHKILANASSLFGIDAATYELWKSTSYAVGGQLTLEKILEATGRAVGKGLSEDVKLFLSPATFAKLAADEAAFRKYDQSYKREATNGFETIKFYSQTGLVEIIPHAMVKEGFAYALTMADWEKCGSQELTFELPERKDEFFRLLENANGYELRAYSDMAVFCHAPNKQILFTGITN